MDVYTEVDTLAEAHSSRTCLPFSPVTSIFYSEMRKHSVNFGSPFSPVTSIFYSEMRKHSVNFGSV
jgi:hypothetical protein